MNTLKSMSIQTMLIIAGSLVLAYSFSLFVYSKDRLDALIYLGLENTAITAIHFAHTVATSDPGSRQDVVNSVDGTPMLVTLTNEPAFKYGEYNTEYDVAFDIYLKSGVHSDDFKNVQFLLSEETVIPNSSVEQMFLANRTPHLLQILYKLPMHLMANVAVQLKSGQWLNVSLPLPDYPSELWSPALMPVGLFTVILILISGWIVRRIHKPLADVTSAAREFSKNIDAPQMKTDHSPEARLVAEAFNEMQRKVKAIIRSRTEMMGAISHDFRTPLTLIKLRAESLPVSTDRDSLMESIGAMEVIINDSLIFAKETFGLETKRKIDMAALLQSICDDFTEAGRNADFLAYSGRIIIKGNPLALQRAFMNIMDNAIKYAGAVRVMMRANKNYVSIYIDDDGPGIPEEELEKVFEPFYRCDLARSEDVGGTGLGLSLAKSVIENHSGQIQLKGHQPKGLSVMVQLELDKD